MEMTDGKVSSKEFAINSGVAGFCRRMFVGEKGCLSASAVYGVPCYEICDERHPHRSIHTCPSHSYDITLYFWQLQLQYRPSDCISKCCIFSCVTRQLCTT